MSSSILCPECKRKLTVPETMVGKSFRCPACKTIIPPASKARAAESDSDSDETEAPSPSGAVKTAPSPRIVPVVPRRRPSRVEDLDEVIDPDDEEPIREKRRQKKRPTRNGSSKGLIIGLAAGGVLLLLLVLGMVVAMFWAVNRVRTIAEAQWQTFTMPGGDCTVLMPGMPQPANLTVNGITINKYLLERKRENAFFAVAYAEFPVNALPPNTLERLINGERDNLMLNKPGFQVNSNSSIALGELPGRELQLKQSRRGMLIERIYLAKVGIMHRMYLVAAGGDYIEPNTGDAARFFDSFKIDVAVSPPRFDAAAALQGGGMRPPAFNPPPVNPQPKMPRPNFPGRRPKAPGRPL